MCNSCYSKKFRKRKTTECGSCGDNAPRGGSTEKGVPVCRKCYHHLKLQPKFICGHCKQLDIRVTTDDDGESVCKKCYVALGLCPTVVCGTCQEVAPREGTNQEGEPVCKRCYQAPSYACIVCDEEAPCASRDEQGDPICHSCYGQLQLQPCVECTECKRFRPRRGPSKEGEALCGKCYKPCECKECGFTTRTERLLEDHKRIHSEWAGKSKDEELIYKTALAWGFTEVRATLDPAAPPSRGQFWRNARVFSELRGDGERMLEADFIFGLSATECHWLEQNGGTHYFLMSWDHGDTSRLEKQQRYDARRREFAAKTPPFPGLTFTEWNSTTKTKEELKQFVEKIFRDAGFEEKPREEKESVNEEINGTEEEEEEEEKEKNERLNEEKGSTNVHLTKKKKVEKEIEAEDEEDEEDSVEEEEESDDEKRPLNSHSTKKRKNGKNASKGEDDINFKRSKTFPTCAPRALSAPSLGYVDCLESHAANKSREKISFINTLGIKIQQK